MSCIRTALQEEVRKKNKAKKLAAATMATQLLSNFHTWVQHMTFSEIALWQDETWYSLGGEEISYLTKERKGNLEILQFSSVQSLSRVWLFVTPWTVAQQASLSITNSRGSPKPMSIESVMPSNHLILCHPLLLPSIFPSIRVFSNESALHIR